MDERSSPAVLYVDDEPINLRVFDANFRGRFPILCCNSGKEALALINSPGQQIGVLISDQRMPEMTGVELLEKVREIAPDIQRMLLTAYSDMQAVMDAVNRGQVSRYFVKPWVKEELLGALEDALRFYRLQGQLREIEARMLRSERLAAIGQVSAGIAHELMNPVSYMTQNISSLRSEMKVIVDYLAPLLGRQPDEAVRQTVADLPALIDDIEAGAKHIRQVALAIRGQARGEEAERESDLAEVANFAVKLARGEVRNQARLVVRGASTRVVGGPVKLTQVLLNLVVNSAHAMEGTGRQGLIEISWSESGGDQVELLVKDNGSGIPKELREKVFEPLFTTKAPGVGTGLGLSICKEIVNGMGGSMSLESEVGLGTTVRLMLKRAPSA